MSFILNIIRKNFNLSLLALILIVLAAAFGAVKTAARSEISAPQATFTVNRTDDAADANAADNICDVDLTAAGQQCTLRAAIAQANATVGADTIDFSLPDNSVITLTAGALVINQSLEIKGSGARNLTVQRTTGQAAPVFHVFNVIGPEYDSPNAIAVSVSRLTIANGLGNTNFGGGIYSFGATTLNLTEVTLRDNRGNNGAAVFNAGNVLNILRSTFSGNRATGSGGAIYNAYGTVNVANSTIANNTAGGAGGGILNGSENNNINLILNNATISGNEAATGGGVTNRKAAFVRNTIIAGNSAEQNPDIEGAADFSSLGNNLIGESDFNVGFINDVSGDIVGTSNAPVNPLLEPLGNNGGPTDTMALIPASPAVEAGNPCVVNSFCPSFNPPAPLLTDQRDASFPRLFGLSVDIGAYELSVPEPVITSISPPQIARGSSEFEIVVRGNGFVNGSIVQWAGQDRPTTFVSPTELRARISAADVQTAGQFVVTVFNPTPGGGVSNGINFVVFNCSFSLTPTSLNLPDVFVGAMFSVTTQPGCAWSATTADPWISIINGSGTGNGTITFTAQANTGPQRTGTITVGGQTFTVNQASGCTFSLNPTNINVSPAGGAFSVAVTSSAAGCVWAATSNAPWITVNNGTGTGNQTVTLTIAANPGPTRTGSVTIAGINLTVNQAGGCAYTVTPTNLNVNAAGGTGSIEVTTAPGCAWTAASNSSWITINSGASGTGSGTVNFTAAANTGAARIGTITVAGQTVTINQPAPTSFNKTPFDFDGDGRADISVFRPSTGGWHILQSSNGSLASTLFGQPGDLIAPADFDGDGRTDVSVFRFGFWYRLNSLTNQFVGVQFGLAGDIPVAADYDGDGLADIAVYRPSNGTWYRINSSNGQLIGVQWGASGDIPVTGDFDGDGRADLAVFRPTNGDWYILRSSDNSSFGLNFGLPGDVPAAADFDGDRKTDISVYRPSNGTWYRINSSNNQFAGFRFGVAEDIPVPADYDGDGLAEIAVYRPSNSFWYLRRPNGDLLPQQWGVTGDVPVPALNR